MRVNRTNSNSVRLSVKVPAGVARLVRDLSKFGGCGLSVEEWATKELIAAAQATIDQLDDGEYLVAACVKKKYGLEELNSEDP